MNRIIHYKQPAVPTGRYVDPIVSILKTGNLTLKIKGKEINSGRMLLMVPFTTSDGMILPLTFPEWDIDLSTTAHQEGIRKSGRIDQIDLVPRTYLTNRLILWAFADESYNPKGFAVTSVPVSSFYLATAASKGSQATLTNINQAYRFTVGSRVRMMRDYGSPFPDASNFNGVWNHGTIKSIDSTTQLKVQLDNEPHGTNLTTGTGAFLEQLDLYRPNLVGTQTPVYPNFRIIGWIDIEDETSIHSIYYEPFTSYHHTINSITPPATAAYILSGANTTSTLSGSIDLVRWLPESNVHTIRLLISCNHQSTSNTQQWLNLYTEYYPWGIARLPGYANASGLTCYDETTVTLFKKTLGWGLDKGVGNFSFRVYLMGYSLS